MKKTSIRFERDASLDGIEVVIRAREQDAAVTALMEKLTGHSPDRLTATDANGNLRPIREEDIILAAVSGKMVNVVTPDGSWYMRQTLQALEAQLDNRRFVRVSRYELINLDRVIRYDFTAAGILRIEMTGGMETWASRRCIPVIRRRLRGREEGE